MGSRGEWDSPFNGAVAIIAKTPRPGEVKTRLCPPLSPEQACDVAWACLHDTLTAAMAVPAERHVVVLDGDPGPWIPSWFEVIPQRGDGLAARLTSAFQDIDDSTIVIAMDTPQVDPRALGGALGSITISGHEAVLGPATDGGFWLIGLSDIVDPVPVFANIPMSTASTGAAQLARLEELRLDPDEIWPLRDIDTIDDLIAVSAEIPSHRTGSLVARLTGQGVITR